MHGRQDFNPLDRVDAEVRIKLHVEIEHVDRVAGLLRHALQQYLVNGLFRHGLGWLRAIGAVSDRRGHAFAAVEKCDDLANGAEHSDLLGTRRPGGRQLFLNGRKDLDALDGINSEIRVETHVELEHFGRIARLLGDDIHHDSRDMAAVVSGGRPVNRSRIGVTAFARIDQVGNRSQGTQRAKLLGPERRQRREPVLQRRKDLHALDGIDPEVGVELHVEIKYLRWIPRFLGDDLDQRGHGH